MVGVNRCCHSKPEFSLTDPDSRNFYVSLSVIESSFFLSGNKDHSSNLYLKYRVFPSSRRVMLEKV